MSRIFVVAISIIIACSSSVAARQVSHKQQGILKIVLSSDGWLTEKMHQEFWSSAPDSIRFNRKLFDAYNTLIKGTSLASLQFQQEVWNSAKISNTIGKPTKTVDYEQSKA